MGTQAQTKVQAQQPQISTITPLKSSLLQRTCMCGESAGIDGECSQCREKRLSSSHSPKLSTAPPLIQRKPSAPDQTRSSSTHIPISPFISHNFNHIRIHPVPTERIQTKLTVNEPGDRCEQEADLVAEQVMRMAAPGTLHAPAPADDKPEDNSSATGWHNSAATHAGTGVPSLVSEVLRSNSGQPLDQHTRSFIEPRLGHDFSRVRIHTDARAAESARAVHALAYTVGQDIVFERGQYAPGTAAGQRLLAHELTHVVQQQAAPVLQKSTGTAATNAFEREAQQTSQAVQRGEYVTVHEHTSTPRVQREEQSWWSRGVSAVKGGLEAVGSTVERGVEATGSAIQSGAKAVGEFAEEAGWSLLNKVAPELVPILRQGVGEWLKGKISAAADGVFSKFLAPIHAVAGVVQSLSAHFTNLVAWMQDAATKILHGDCSSISAAAEKVQQVLDGISSPIVNRVKQLTQSAGNAFTSLWSRFGQPAWNFLSTEGGAAWEHVKQFSSSIWDKTASLRAAGGKAWTWIKNKLGIGDEADGQQGLLQWIQRKTSEAWNWLKAKIEPIKAPLLAVGRVLLVLSPAGPFIALGTGVSKLLNGIRWIRQHWHTPQLIVQMRDVLYNTIIPDITSAANSVSAALGRASTFIMGKLNEVLSGFNQTIKAIADPVLHFVSVAVHWIAGQFHALTQTITEKLPGLTNLVHQGLGYLHSFMQFVREVLRGIIRFGANPLGGLGGLLTGIAWRQLPQCLKTVIINFILDVLIAVVRVGRLFDIVVPGVGPLLYLIHTAMLGFLRKIRFGEKESDKTAIADRFARLASQGSYKFSKGYLWGLVLGLWDGISGPFIFLWDIAKLIAGLFKFLWRTVEAMAKPETYRRILQGLQSTWQTVQTQIVPAIEELLRGKTDPMKIIGFITGLVNKGLRAVEGVGASVADALLGLIQQSDDEKLGEGIGRITGNILFEVILIVATEGIYAARTAIGKLAEQVAEGAASVLGEIIAFSPKLMRLIDGISEFASNNRAIRAIIDAVKSIFRGLLRFIEVSYGLAGAEERALAKGERLVGDVKREVKFVDEVTGEEHVLQLLGDGRIIRCSSKCMEIVDSILERAPSLKGELVGATRKVTKQLATIEKEAQAIAKRAKELAALTDAERAAQGAAKEEEALLEKVKQLEQDMLTLENQVPGKGIQWVDEGTFKPGDAYEYESGAEGAQSNILTRNPRVPSLLYRDANGAIRRVRFDGVAGTVLIDRKLSITFYPKAQRAALRQSEALLQNGLTGLWEVPTEAEARRARNLFEKLGISNIDVKVVPE